MGWTTYRIDEAGLSVDIPADLVVFTEDMADDDPALAALGIAKADMLEFMKDNNLFLEALEQNANYEIVLTASDSEIMDFSQLSEDEISWLRSGIQSNLADMGLTFQKFEYYEHSQTEFLKVYFSQSSGEITNHALEYFTIYGGKIIVITMNSYSGDIDGEKENSMQRIIDSICFDAEPVVETPAFLYEDSESGVSFTVPANWTEKPLDSDEYADIREDIEKYGFTAFVSNFDRTCVIGYSCTDAWSLLPEEEKSKYSRAECDNSLFSYGREIVDPAEDKLPLVTYGGKEYFQIPMQKSASRFGHNVPIDGIELLRVENGYEYLFLFLGSCDDVYYEDFEILLNSVQYPEVAPAAEEKEEPEAPAEKPAIETAEDTINEDTLIPAVKETDRENKANDDTSARTKAAVLEALVKALGATALYSFLTIAVLYVIRKRKKS